MLEGKVMFKDWLKSIEVYADRRMITMLLLGFSSGFPLLLVFGTLSLWLKNAGLSLVVIGFFSLTKIPYSFKWLWSPIVDRVSLPFFHKFGRRRGWALFSQLLLLFGILGMALQNPAYCPYMMAVFAFFVAFFSATQDIVLDAYRIESFNNREQGAGAAIFVLGYRFGLIFSGAGALWLASVWTWNEVYLLMAAGTFVGMAAVLLSPEPKKVKEDEHLHGTFRQKAHEFFYRAVVCPFQDFLKRPDWWLILLFVMCYKLCDAYMMPMTMPFYDDMGFTKKEIAYVTKFYGIIAAIVGGLIGGVIINRCGVMRSLVFCGVIQGLSNLVFVLQAHAGHDLSMLMFTISVENLAGGMGTAAFVAYISSLCNVAYTATQYALLSSFMSLIRDVFAATSGFLAASVSWSTFFILTAAMALPGLILLGFMLKLYPGKKDA